MRGNDPLAGLPQHTYTRWRDLNHQVDASDPIDPDGPRYVDGELPSSYVLLLWDGNALRGPMRFSSPAEATTYLESFPGIRAFLIVPSPFDV